MLTVSVGSTARVCLSVYHSSHDYKVKKIDLIILSNDFNLFGFRANSLLHVFCHWIYLVF